ncbi:MAG: hypothetical protein OEO17_01705 [Gemmatimonadota bacterium]|nr:hypothetical protein [Gemmatimonadota bacterium]MDH3366530.1 hypothetical protein [Gemmatimonadota bacterium]
MTRQDMIKALQQYERIRRQMAWYRRLWRWLKAQVVTRQKGIDDLTPDQRAALQEQLAVAAAREAPPTTKETPPNGT